MGNVVYYSIVGNGVNEGKNGKVRDRTGTQYPGWKRVL